MKMLALVIVIGFAFTCVGICIGAVKAYGFFSQTIEERVIRDANAELLRVGVRKYELAIDGGTVMVIRRK